MNSTRSLGFFQFARPVITADEKLGVFCFDLLDQGHVDKLVIPLARIKLLTALRVH